MVITPTVTLLLRGENNSKQSDEFQASNYWQLIDWLIDWLINWFAVSAEFC